MGYRINHITPTLADIAIQRLHHQHLLKGLSSAVDVVHSLGAVQSQDFTGAKWALGQRCASTSDDEVTRLFNEGKILRTHMLRPTWHFVAPQDLRWMQELTAPRVHAFNKYYYNKLGLTEAVLKNGSDILVKALEGGNELTRREMKETFENAGMDAGGLRLTYLIMYAELEALVCSGALRGKQHTIALLTERVPGAKSLPREEALIELTKRFFASHGPATVQDLAWWSSLTIADVKKGIELAGLQCIEVENSTFYSVKSSDYIFHSPVMHLLPNFDEYVIAYRNRSPFTNLQLDKAPSYEELSSHFVTLDGQLIGGWKRTATPKSFMIRLNLFRKLLPEQLGALDITANRLQNFLGIPIKIN